MLSLVISFILLINFSHLVHTSRAPQPFQRANEGRQNHLSQQNEIVLVPPIVINTWNFTDANTRAWQELAAKHSALDAIEWGCGQCEIDRCDGTVGWGGSPSETGETTLDAMIMDGETYDVGAVGGLRRIKSAISVARMVLERTNHTLLVGDMATKFAVEMGFKEEPLTSKESRKMHMDWLANSCQPNYWKNVVPDPRTSCGPYKIPPTSSGPQQKADKNKFEGRNNFLNDQRSSSEGHRHSNSNNNYHYSFIESNEADVDEDDFDRYVDGSELSNDSRSISDPVSLDHVKTFAKLNVGHDTIGMVAMDSQRKLASGTTTNGLRYKILGRVGDSPVPGAGSYAAKEAGAAAATGDGDVMMRFLLSYQAVENLRQGMRAQEAATDVIMRQISRTGRPYARAAVIVLAKNGSFGASCCGYKKFPFVVSDSKSQVVTHVVECIN